MKAETKRKCPKCKSRFGVKLINQEVICFYGFCDWKIGVKEWNLKYKRSQLG